MTLEEKYGPIPFEVNDWGSCQYSSAKWLYDLYFKLREESSFEEVLESLNIRVSSISVNSRLDFDAIKHDFVDYFDEEWDDLAPDWQEDVADDYREMKKATKVEDLFEFLRNMAWDLWGAAPRIASCAFPGLDIKVEESPGYGPVFNILTQSENFEVAVCCILLKEFGYVENEDCFSGFCT